MLFRSGRRYGHGLHQAIEAKENVEIQRESKTLATITFQNYFRLYDKLAGMTGTAKTEEDEFEQIYRLRTFVIPTNRPLVRADTSDAIYRTVAAKFKAVAKIVEEKHEKGQPVLVGTTSIEKSEALSALLTQNNVQHEVLNAKQHEREAEIIAGAGEKGSVTIATNMAGRGTDIKLGEGVKELGGLVILGSERHEARRIDNQLRGRSGRQGDPGESQFFVSMEDDLMRLFGGDRLKMMMEKMNVPDDVPLENHMVSRAIENAQKKVEGHNFDIRKHVVQYDDVMNKHRGLIYRRRQRLLTKMTSESPETELSLHDEILSYIAKEIAAIVSLHASSVDPEEWNLQELATLLAAIYPPLGAKAPAGALQKYQKNEELRTHLVELAQKLYKEKCTEFDPSLATDAERIVTLRAIDTHWMDHIDEMAHLREQVAFSGFAQRDPLIEYKDRGFRLFQALITRIESSIVRMLFQIDFRQFGPEAMLEQAGVEQDNLETNIDEIEGELTETSVASSMKERFSSPADRSKSEGWSESRRSGTNREAGIRRVQAGSSKHEKVDLPTEARRAKVGRNDPCPCGSGKKFKKCHGQFS